MFALPGIPGPASAGGAKGRGGVPRGRGLDPKAVSADRFRAPYSEGILFLECAETDSGLAAMGVSALLEGPLTMNACSQKSGRPRLLTSRISRYRRLLVSISFSLTASLVSAEKIDLRRAISGGDLHYSEPVTRSEEGMPIGTGRMGSLVWTTPTALKFQINRVDVFAVDASTVSFPRADSDYASGCGYVDINVVAAGDDVFVGPEFRQDLSLYDGIMSVKGRGVTVRVLGWPKADVMAVEIDDQRSHPEPISINLRMLRYQMQGFFGENYRLMREHAVKVQTANHTATSQLGIRDGRITLTQRFEEFDFYDSSAVAIGVEGRSSKARYLNESTVQLAVPAGRGKFTVLISTAASFDRKHDTASAAVATLQSAVSHGFAGLAADTATSWHDFWSRGFVAMSSGDKQADFVGGNYVYFMYLMNASSRGPYPPRFGGMLWYTNGDYRRWGSQYWHANTDAYYRDLMSSGHLELSDPFFSFYSGMYDACALAARQQWGSQGIYIPEITFFSGPEKLPDTLVQEFQDLFLARKSYEDRSPEFQAWVETKNRHSSRYNFLNDGKYVHGRLVVPTKGQGIFGHCTHFLSGAVGVASQFWQRYEFTGDKAWLRDKAYPMIKGVAEFYRNFPNVKKEADGKYHIHHVNRIESDWDSSDTPSELNAMATIFPLARRASEILRVDEELRPKWQDIADNLASPGPGSGKRGNFDTVNPERAAARQRQRAAQSGDGQRQRSAGPRPFGSFVYAGDGAIEPMGPEPELKSRFLGFNRLGSFIDAEGTGGAQIFRNRLRLREGPGAIDAEHIGGLSFGIHQSLLASSTNPDLTETKIQVFPAWPKDWDVTFRLLARGAFMVTAAQAAGKVRLVEVESQRGGDCQIVNPWGSASVAVYRNGQVAENLNGATLTVRTVRGERIALAPAGEPYAPFAIGKN